jgi:hypothetical protein
MDVGWYPYWLEYTENVVFVCVWHSMFDTTPRRE